MRARTPNMHAHMNTGMYAQPHLSLLLGDRERERLLPIDYALQTPLQLENMGVFLHEKNKL